MNTDELIGQLRDEVAETPRPTPFSWTTVLIAAASVTGLALALTLGVRPDFVAALAEVRFDFKFVLCAALAVCTLVALKELAHPTGEKRTLSILLLPAALLTGAVVIELFVLPPHRWMAHLVGQNGFLCVTAIPLFGLVPLGLFLYASRKRAPLDPVLQGTLSGLAAASVGAFFYAAHCTDDSPLFVATWYTLAMAVLVGLGALVGSRVLRW